MGRLRKLLPIGLAVGLILALAGCPGSGPVVQAKASLAFVVDLTPIYAAGLTPSAVSASVVSGGTIATKDLSIATVSQKATGELSGLAEGIYDATITISAGQTVLGSGSGRVTATARTTNTINVTITVSAPAAVTDPTLGVVVR